MDELLRKVKKELDSIGEKGLTASNLDTTYKLIDIYKDIKEACYYESQTKDWDNTDVYGARSRDSRGRYMEHYPLDDRTERHFERMREGMYNYNEGKMRYKDGNSKERMIDGVEMTMSAIINFIESMIDFAETNTEKEIVRKYVDKLKNI